MALLSANQALNMKLNTVPMPLLRDLARIVRVDPSGSSAVLVKRLLDANISGEVTDRFIRGSYLRERIVTRRAIISDEDLQAELSKVEDFFLGVVQGQLDQSTSAGTSHLGSC